MNFSFSFFSLKNSFGLIRLEIDASFSSFSFVGDVSLADNWYITDEYDKRNKGIYGVLDKDVVDPDDVEMLQDLIITCVNEALRKVDAEQASQMGKFNIPGF